MKKKVIKTLALILSSCLISNLYAKNYNIQDLGANPSGTVKCTEIIQKAIDDCSASGGGTVIIPTGKFLTGSIFLKDNVNLYLESGSVLLGSTDIEDYKPTNLIQAIKAKNISITGQGTIDGQGHAFWIPADRSKIPYERAPGWKHKKPSSRNLIRLEACNDVMIKDVKLKGSESWTCHLLGCDKVIISGISIRNPLHGPNTDGIDMQACSNVRISNCDIYTRDDAICIKNRDPKYYDKTCENITVTNCIITTVCNAFKIGTESIGDFKNIVFSNSVIKAADPTDEMAKVAATYIDLNANRYGLAPSGGISLETVDGANLQGVSINNIVMDGVWCPIFLRLANRGAGKQKVSPSVPGTLKDVIISNIVAYNASVASSISAIEGSYVENVLLSDILIKTQGGGSEELAALELDELEKSYPDPKMWGRSLSRPNDSFSLPIAGLFVRHVQGLQLDNIKIMVDDDDMRPLVLLEDVNDLYINNLKTSSKIKGESVVVMKNVKNADIFNIRFPVNIPWFSIKGKNTDNINIKIFKSDNYKDIILKEDNVNDKSIKVY